MGSACTVNQEPPQQVFEIVLGLCQTPAMEFDFTDFSPEQHRALLELLILATLADGKLTTAENNLIQQVLTAMGCTEDADRQQEFESTVARLRPEIKSVPKAKGLALLLTDAFTTRPQHKLVYVAVQQIMGADKHVSAWESTLLSELRLRFRL